MAFCRQMDDAVHIIFLHQFQHGIKITDICLDEGIVGLALNVLEVGQVARIGQLVNVDDVILWVFIHEKANDMRADEACTAGNDNILHKVLLLCV